MRREGSVELESGPTGVWREGKGLTRIEEIGGSGRGSGGRGAEDCTLAGAGGGGGGSEGAVPGGRGGFRRG